MQFEARRDEFSDPRLRPVSSCLSDLEHLAIQAPNGAAVCQINLDGLGFSFGHREDDPVSKALPAAEVIHAMKGHTLGVGPTFSKRMFSAG
jgi:hypothetical protein